MMEILNKKHIKIKGKQGDALYILSRLRFYTKRWERDYGAMNKNQKKAWEAKADELLKQATE